MRYLLAVMVFVLGLGAVVLLVYGVGSAMVMLGLAPNELWPAGLMMTLVLGAAAGIGSLAVKELAGSYRMRRFIHWLESKKRVRPVPLSDLIKKIEHDPERWKEQV
jgi:hypothetical protein